MVSLSTHLSGGFIVCWAGSEALDSTATADLRRLVA